MISENLLFMESSLPKKIKYDYFDFLKAIAIFLVVISHFNNLGFDLINDNGLNTHINYIFRSIFAVSVPIFLFINGALLLNKSNLDLKGHIIKTLKILGILIIWGFITLVSLLFIRNESWSIIEIIKGVMQIKQGWINHLWFLEALIIIYLFFPLIYNSYKNHLSSFYFFLAVVMLFTFGNTLIGNIVNVGSYFIEDFKHVNYAINYFKGLNPFNGTYGYTFGYFMLGGVLFYHREYLNKKVIRILSFIIIPVSMYLLYIYGYMISIKEGETWNSVWFGKDFLFTLLSVFAIFVLSLKYKHIGFWGKAIKTIGENSLGIYLIHIIIGEILFPHFVKLSLSSNIVINLVFVLVVLLLSLFIALGLKKIPYLKHLLLA